MYYILYQYNLEYKEAVELTEFFITEDKELAYELVNYLNTLPHDNKLIRDLSIIVQKFEFRVKKRKENNYLCKFSCSVVDLLVGRYKEDEEWPCSLNVLYPEGIINGQRTKEEQFESNIKYYKEIESIRDRLNSLRSFRIF